MGNNNQRALCQQLWARNKYLVLTHSSNIYNEIRQYLKNEEVEVSQVQEMIDRACQIPEHRGQVCNAFQHIWGYFKKKATDAERKDYMLLLDRYRFGQASKEDLITKTRDLLDRYPNTYLQHSTLLKGDCHETLAWGFDFTASPSSALGATSRVLRPAWQWLGQKACDGWLCFYPLALSSLCLSSFNHGRNDWPWLQCQSRVVGQELPW